VTGTMSITSVLFYAVAHRCWGWSVWRAGGLVAVFLVVDLAFFGANLAKILHGGWFPMLLAGGVFAVMSTWRYGASWRARQLAELHMPFDALLATLKLNPPGRVKGTAVFMTQDPDGTPPALLHQLKHNQVLHEQVVILTILGIETPTVSPADRVETAQIGRGFWRGVARHGFRDSAVSPGVTALA